MRKCCHGTICSSFSNTGLAGYRAWKQASELRGKMPSEKAQGILWSRSRSDRCLNAYDGSVRRV
jgi:hypothetical protein